MIHRYQRWTLAGIATLLIATVAGCPADFEDVLQNLELTFDNSIDVIQTDDPRDIVVFPDEFDNTIIIGDDVDVIVDISNDLTVDILPDITILGFENLTGWDIYVTYAVDGEEQGVLVYDGETLLLEYGCLTFIELIWEEDFDPFTGVFVDEYDLSATSFLSPLDFDCGEALIVTIDAFGVSATAEYIDLVN